MGAMGVDGDLSNYSACRGAVGLVKSGKTTNAKQLSSVHEMDRPDPRDAGLSIMDQINGLSAARESEYALV